jgi:hypothetical protein
MSLPPPSPKQASLIWLALTGLALAVIVGLVIALIWGLSQALDLLSPVLWPIALAAVLAYLLDPVVDFLESRKVPRTRGIIMVFFCAIMLLLGLLGSVVPQLVSETSDLVQRVPVYAHRTQTNVVNWIKNPPAPLRKFLEKRLHGDTPTNSLPATNLVAETTAAAGTNLIISVDITSSTNNAPFQWGQFFDEQAIGSTAHWRQNWATPGNGSSADCRRWPASSVSSPALRWFPSISSICCWKSAASNRTGRITCRWPIPR